jgi:transcriptional regulator with XRE-family HTH domain
MTNEQLAIARKALGISQAELANRIGVATSFIALIESNRRDIPESRRRQIREALPVTDEEVEVLMTISKRMTTR